MAKAKHRKVHTNEYHENVEKRLRAAEKRGGSNREARAANVRQELKKIGSELEE